MTDDPTDISHLDFVVEEPTPTDLTSLTLLELLDLEVKVKGRLIRSHQMYAPAPMRTEDGKELHSTYTAIQIERRRRIAEAQ